MRDAVEAELDGVDDLVDHHFAEFEFLVVAFADVLGDYRAAVEVGVGEGGAAVGLPVCCSGGLGLVVVVEGGDVRGFAYAAVALCAGAVVFPAEVEGFQEEHYGYLDEGDEDEDDL